MARFNDRDEVHEFVSRNIDPPADAGLEDGDEARASMTPTITALQRAIKEEDADSAKLQARLLEPQIRFAQSALAFLVQASVQIDALVEEKGDAVTAELRAMQPKLKRVAQGKALLQASIGEAQRLLRQAGELASKAASGERAAATRWNVIMASYRRNCADVMRCAKQARIDLQRAAAAVKARDPAELARIARAVSGYANDMRAASFDNVRNVIGDFLNEYAPQGMGRELGAQVKRESGELGELAARAKPALLEILRIQSGIERMSVEPPDAAAIAKMLGVPSKWQGEVKNALRLNESGMVKALDSIGKQAGIKTTGREMVARLKREKLVKLAPTAYRP